ncbi:hypothetical protein FE810_09610 [Thalassotalea litorea]|uniref:PhoD-like phosphatase metallophosphatase domain-containing protein n=1 Tax=Thalassotalea litorea TaxID=2020715 RepID=A0A5R9ITC0_9GAMM|nr:alkaline phosphatase D family protein [Thalassotalea litorea]TLU65168.1 hypothetical protein FE810_09610 [Thalassotalea litorea]
MQRRQFLKGGAFLGASALLPLSLRSMAAKSLLTTRDLKSVVDFNPDVTRHWLGESLWGNRLQDWQLNQGRVECLQGDKSFEVRTVSLLTHQLNDKPANAHLRVKLGLLTQNRNGFAGFIIGAGGTELDYRGASLVQRAGGTNGGLMAVVDEKGALSFRDFSNDAQPLNYRSLKAKPLTKTGKFSRKAFYLDLQINAPAPGQSSNNTLVLTLSDAGTGKALNQVALDGIDAQRLAGNILLLSSPPVGEGGARWWFNELALTGDKVEENLSQTLGPAVGCLYSLNQDSLRLSAQLMPVASNEYQKLRLESRESDNTDAGWKVHQTAPLEEGFVAAFDIENWPYQLTHDYRIVDVATERELYSSQIVKDPGNAQPLKIALHSCLTATAKSLDAGPYVPRIKQEKNIGRYSKDNILFPHQQLVQNCDSHQPDLYVFCGDQFYEGVPTRVWRNKPDSKLDLLYRWYLWYWTYRDSVRNRPVIMLADDHDVLQGNLWGVGGRDPVVLETDKRMEEDGGYTQTKSLVRMAYRIQHSHNPRPYDPTPIDHGIEVTYGAFIYGATSFALVEDRKFKSRRNTKVDPRHAQGELLGLRQEMFLRAWKNMHPGLPKVCLTASMWGSAQTQGNVKPLLDYDSNGYPYDGRTRAVQLIKDAGAVVLAGDQHLAMVARQGIDDFTDGPLFFAGPAGAAFWQRWFEGEGRLENKRNNDPNTGDFTDTFGNKMHLLAVANPKVTYQSFKSQVGDSWSNFLADPAVKSEGYGLVRVDHQQQAFEFECWEWSVDPKTGKQFDGWPYRLSFSDV